MTETDRLAELLRDADPLPTDAAASDRVVLDRTWARLEAELATSTVVPLRRRRVRAVIAGTAALAVLCGGTAVAAELLKARTGVVATPSTQTEEFAPGEVIDLTAPDLREAVMELTRDVPFPSEAVRHSVVYGAKDFDPIVSAGPDKYVSSSAGERFTVARYAVCAWSDDFVAATAANDSTRRKADVTALAAAPAWRAFSLVDGSGTLNEATAGIRDEYVGTAQSIADAAAGGDLARLKKITETWCVPVAAPAGYATAPGGPAARTATEPATTATERPAPATAPELARMSQPTTKG